MKVLAIGADKSFGTAMADDHRLRRERCDRSASSRIQVIGLWKSSPPPPSLRCGLSSIGKRGRKHRCRMALHSKLPARAKLLSVTDPAEKPYSSCKAAARSAPIRPAPTRPLAMAGYMPSWVAGISIGAVNSAIIAGNPPEKRVERLREFWERVSAACSPGRSPTTTIRAASSTRPARRSLPSAAFQASSSRACLPPCSSRKARLRRSASTTPNAAQETLLELVDFDLLNSGAVRLSVGAVQVITGNMKYFDTAKQFVGPEHVMASGALPPGFPPIEIDNEPYWDGGLVSNTPLEYVLERSGPREDMVIFQVDLFSARGCMPQTLFDIGQRERRSAIRAAPGSTPTFSARCRPSAGPFAACGGAYRTSSGDNPDWRLLDGVSCNAAVTILLLIHRRAAYWTQSNDYEFSRYSMDEHWLAGRRGRRAQLQPSRLEEPHAPRGRGEGARSHPRSRHRSQGASLMTIGEVEPRAFAMPLSATHSVAGTDTWPRQSRLRSSRGLRSASHEARRQGCSRYRRRERHRSWHRQAFCGGRRPRGRSPT